MTMPREPQPRPSLRSAALALGLASLASSCLSSFEARHETLSDARDQIWLADESQVMLRNAQSRVFETADRARLLAAVVQTMQDLGFQVEALDVDLGLVSGRRFDATEGEDALDPTYHLYDDQSLLLLTRSYRTWGPFLHRADLVRITVTVRSRNDRQTVVRASAQFYLRAVENAEPYQRFFAALANALAIEAMQLPSEPPAAAGPLTSPK
jgi:hypothetical protein